MTKILAQSPFDRFWSAYPRKTAKIKAEAAFKRVDVDVDTLIAAVEQQKLSEQWRRGVIPHAATWLNQQRWQDEQPDYGACKFCSQPAIGQIQGVGHCAIDRHIDQARDWARRSK